MRAAGFCDQMRTAPDFADFKEATIAANPDLRLDWLNSWNFEFVCEAGFSRQVEKDARKFCEAYFVAPVVEEGLYSMLREDYMKLWGTEIVFDMMNSVDVQFSVQKCVRRG